jgi:hypothetical protein
MITLIVIGTASIAIVLITFLIVVIAGIRACERRMNLTGQPVTRAERLACHLLSGGGRG